MMNTSRLWAFIGIVAIAMIAVQGDALLSAIDPNDALFTLDPSLPVLLVLALLIAFAVRSDGAVRSAPRRRRVNRARLRARRAAA
jgi:hypothetical protein